MANVYSCPKCGAEGQEYGLPKELPYSYGTEFSFPYSCPDCKTKWKVEYDEQVLDEESN